MTGGMKPGDYAGLAAFQNAYGFIGVRTTSDGKSIVMATNGGSGDPEEADSRILHQDVVFLKIDFDFTDGRDKAVFFYSLDGMNWQPLGCELSMRDTWITSWDTASPCSITPPCPPGAAPISIISVTGETSRRFSGYRADEIQRSWV